jgi:hypothetical protein
VGLCSLEIRKAPSRIHCWYVMLLLVHKVKQTRDKLKENRRDVGLVEHQHRSVDEMLSDRGRNGSGSDEEQGGLICLKKN